MEGCWQHRGPRGGLKSWVSLNQPGYRIRELPTFSETTLSSAVDHWSAPHVLSWQEVKRNLHVFLCPRGSFISFQAWVEPHSNVPVAARILTLTCFFPIRHCPYRLDMSLSHVRNSWLGSALFPPPPLGLVRLVGRWSSVPSVSAPWGEKDSRKNFK